MSDFNRREWRDADAFYADLMHGPGPRGPRRSARPAEAVAEAEWHEAEAEWTEAEAEWTEAEAGELDEASVIEDVSGATVEMLSPFPAMLEGGGIIEAGRVFDDLVHRGRHMSEVIAEADEDAEWEAVALPRSSTPPKDLPPGALVIKRALGEGRLASVLILGQTVGVPGLYAVDGRIRPDILILVRRSRSAPRPATVVLSAEDSDTSFLRWSPATRAGRFPPRPGSAKGGRAFIATINSDKAPADWLKREKAIVAELVSGNIPDALLKWVTIDLSYTGKGGPITGSIQVLPDYLSVGSNDDYVQVPLDPVSAQYVADKFDTMLPTARICHAIYQQAPAKNRLTAIERDYWQPDQSKRVSAKAGRDQTSTAAYLEHADEIQRRTKAAGLALGDLIAGHKKDVCIARRLHQNVERIAFHGFYDAAGYPHEPCYENKDRKPGPSCAKDAPVLAHTRRFSDYSQGVRLVHPTMIVNGQSKRVADVLSDPQLSFLISSEGPVVPARIPKTTKPAIGPGEADEAVESESPEAELVESEAEVVETETEWMAPAEGDPAPEPSSVTIPAATGLGTEKTAAPIATVSPHRQMNERLDRELILFAKARHIADWINTRLSSTFDQLLADRALLTKLDLSKDNTLWQKLRPFPMNTIPEKRGQLFTEDTTLTPLLRAPSDAAGLRPILEMLQDYGVVLLPKDPKSPQPATSILASVTRVEAKLDRARFDAQSALVEKRALKFKQDVGNKGILHHAVDSEPIPADWWPDKTTPLAVARPVMALLRRIRERNTAWRAGTYASHFWNDFSVDIFLAAGLNTDDGFWARPAVRDFFKALNTACEQDAGPGRFAWKAIYNDAGLAQEMDRLYGAGRVLSGVDGHGPGPRMHIHLDVRPLTVPFDGTTGFKIDGRRIVVPAPASTGATTRTTREDEQADEAVPQKGRGAFRHTPLDGDPGDNVEVRWNLDSTTTANSVVDVVVHLHGYGKKTDDFLARKAGAAGVDLLDASGALKVRAKKPTVVIIPRGQFTAPRSWHFNALSDKAAFDALCDAALAWVATSVLKLPAGSTLKPGRVTLMAHSGGGAGLATLLNKGVNPDEVVCFDSMYGGEDAIKQWADARIQSKQPSQYGLRVFYTGCSGPLKDAPGGRWVPQKKGDPVYEEPGSWSFWPSDKKWHLGSTEVSARRLQYALDRMLTSIKDGAALAPRYRVERTAVGHSDIPSRYGPLLLDDIGAKMPDASAAPAATSRPACVDNDDWISKPPIKPGGTDPPPLKPMNPEKPADK